MEQDFVAFKEKEYHKKQISANQFHYMLYIPHSMEQEALWSDILAWNVDQWENIHKTLYSLSKSGSR